MISSCCQCLIAAGKRAEVLCCRRADNAVVYISIQVFCAATLSLPRSIVTLVVPVETAVVVAVVCVYRSSDKGDDGDGFWSGTFQTWRSPRHYLPHCSGQVSFTSVPVFVCLFPRISPCSSLSLEAFVLFALVRSQPFSAKDRARHLTGAP